MDSRQRVVSAGLRAAVWSLAIGVAVIGVVLSVVLSSVWPLLAVLGLAVPMVPVGTLRGVRADAARAHTDGTHAAD